MSSNESFFQQKRGGPHLIKMNPSQYDPYSDPRNPYFGRHNQTIYRNTSGPTVPADSFQEIVFQADVEVNPPLTALSALDDYDYSGGSVNLGIIKVTIDEKEYNLLYS